MKIVQNPDGTFEVTFDKVPSSPPYQLTLLLAIGALLALLPAPAPPPPPPPPPPPAAPTNFPVAPGSGPLHR